MRVKTEGTKAKSGLTESDVMHRFFVKQNQIADGRVTIAASDANHIRRVLRMREGDTILVSCGDEWEYTCRLASFQDDGSILADITDIQKPGKELSSDLFLLQCLPKGQKLEHVIQKSVELGVRGVLPVSSARSGVRLDKKKAEAKGKRWNSIAESAAKQSLRLQVPEVYPVMTLDAALAWCDEQRIDVRLIPWEKCAGNGMRETRKILAAVRPGESVAILIGPEGGFEDREANAALAAGFAPVSLGRRILRTETAGLALLSALMLQLEED